MAPAGAAEKTYVYAASSMTNAVTAFIEQLHMETPHRYVGVFGASSTLARQIIQGAPAHIYITAHSDWMEAIAKAKLVETETRQNIAKNSLVVVAPTANARPLELTDVNAFSRRLANGRLAMSDPTHVPAGIYGKQALVSLGLWAATENRLAIASNVRIALAYVERGETPLGILYASDLVGRPDVTRVATFPQTSHSPIKYTMAVIRSKATESARAFQRFLQSEKARAILNQLGFEAL